MEPLSGETLTILIIVAVVLAGVTLIVVSILIIYILCSNRSRSTTIKPIDTHSIVSSVSSDSRTSSSSVMSPVLLKTPVASTDQRTRQVQQSRLQKHSTDSISVIDEHLSSTYNNKKKQPKEREQQVYERDGMTTVNESRTYDHRHPQKQNFKPITDIQFIDRHTPYPPDVLARERVMMNHLRFPRANKFDDN